MNKGRRFGIVLLFALLILPPILVWRYPEKSYNLAQKAILKYREEIKGGLTVDDGGNWKEDKNGLAYRTIKIHRGKETLGVSIKAVRIDPKFFDFKVITVPAEKISTTSINAIAKSYGAKAIINGSFFNSQLGILGLAISDGKETSVMTRAGANRAMFFVKGGLPGLIHRDSFSKQGITQALQAGPWLVMNKEEKTRFKHPDRIDRRSGVCIDKKAQVIFVITDTAINGITLPHFAKVMAMSTPDGLECENAVNLDGGTSAQLLSWVKGSKITVRGFTNVPVYIAAIPKEMEK